MKIDFISISPVLNAASFLDCQIDRYGDRRRISVFKTKKKKGSNKEEETTTSLKFQEETRNVLHDLFTQYPPDDGELSEPPPENGSQKADQGQWKLDSTFCKPLMREADIKKKLELYASRINGIPHLKKVSFIV